MNKNKTQKLACCNKKDIGWCLILTAHGHTYTIYFSPFSPVEPPKITVVSMQWADHLSICPNSLRNSWAILYFCHKEWTLAGRVSVWTRK